jgi:hypothetical protein
MFTGTLKTFGLAKGNLVFRSEFNGGFGPHGLAAIKAATGLAGKSDGTRFNK